MDIAFHRPKRQTKHLCNLIVGKLLYIAQIQCASLSFRERQDVLFKIPLHIFGKYFIDGRESLVGMNIIEVLDFDVPFLRSQIIEAFRSYYGKKKCAEFCLRSVKEFL